MDPSVANHASKSRDTAFMNGVPDNAGMMTLR